MRAPGDRRAVAREDHGEALTGEECTGQPLSRERVLILGADSVHMAEGNTTGCASASAGRPGVVRDPGMCRSPPDVYCRR
jgi:hypothetical protein